MVNNNITDCEKCIHNEICSIKNQVKQTMRDVNFQFGGTDSKNVGIFVLCLQFNGRTNLRRTAGFD